MSSPVRRVRRLVAAAAALSAVLTLSACGGGDDGGTAKGVELVSEGKLTVCTHLPYKPFQFRDDSGEVVGFDVDILDLLAKDLDVDIEVVDIAWEQIMSGAVFASKKCDIGMGAMTITDDRERDLLISDPYFDATQALLVPADSSVESLADLDGKKLGVQTDTTGQVYAEEQADANGYEMIVFDDSISEFNGVKTGKVDAAINDNTVLTDFVEQNDDTKVAAEFDTGEQYGFPAEKDDENAQKLIDRLNDVLAKAKQDGEYDKIYKEWFGTTPGANTDG
ncbi:ABC transporter substrate-binding protein [Solicola gregarius]|uniref:ABC transporter substrate-binding protein n=1 Tax=Solicola gregarius TaxID=2908642 RepID=A0AA46TIG7_9ACTN|nr:ABC transporter substrate-binding protein [Solicola gregarius]UYM05750.1 ABC transporter substrate-binding protein [Solicola gregarius]